MVDMVTIEDSTVLTMLQDARFTSEIPCLFNKLEVFRNGPGSCGACARKRQQKQRTEMAAIKACLAALAPDKKQALKNLLGAKKVRVVFAQPSGEVVQLTF